MKKSTFNHILWVVRNGMKPHHLFPTICRALALVCIIACIWNPWQVFSAIILMVIADLWEHDDNTSGGRPSSGGLLQ